MAETAEHVGRPQGGFKSDRAKAAYWRLQYESVVGALADLIAENTENVEAIREALESLDSLCAAEDTHGDTIRAHEVRGAVADLRRLVSPPAWPCDNYTEPHTCLTTGCTTPCDSCRASSDNSLPPGMIP